MALALAGTAEAGARCDAVKIDRLPVCAEGAGGVVLAKDQAKAEAIVARMEIARPLFETLFGRAAPAYAVVYDKPPADEIAALKAAGYPSVLAWTDPDLVLASFEDKIRAAIRQQIPGMTKEQEDAIVAEKMAELRSNIGGPSAAAHEMGHLWYSHVFWADAPDASGEEIAGHYGSPGPDWLDEISGVVFEDEAGVESRRMRFRDLWRQGTGIFDLPTYLTMEHPEIEKVRAMARARPPGDTSGTVIMPAGSSPNPIAASAFYAQGRVFADFLTAEAGGDVLGVIATAIAKGETFDDWLAREGKGRGLPGDVAGLTERWRAWATETYGAPG